MTYTKTFSLADGVALARAIKVSTDIGDKLIAVTIDTDSGTVTCTFEENTGVKAQPPAMPVNLDASDGAAFAGAMKAHTDAGRALVWLIVSATTNQASCWFQ